jgi:hypothetical protein
VKPVGVGPASRDQRFSCRPFRIGGRPVPRTASVTTAPREARRR